SEGGPVFTAGGGVVGITSVVDEKDDRRRGDSRVVRIDDVCDVVASAERKMSGAAAPPGTHLPVEPARPFPVEALKEAAQRRAGSGDVSAADQALQIRLLAAARLLRRCRGHTDPPVQAGTARLGERRAPRRSLRLRSRCAWTAVRVGQARTLFGEGAGEGRCAGGRSEGAPADLAGLRTVWTL